MSDRKTIPSFGAMLRKALKDAIIPEAGEDFLAMCADDIVFKFPFTPNESLTEIIGLEAITRYLAKIGAVLEFESFSDPIIHESKDGETFILEFSCQGKGTQTAARYDQNYVAVISIQQKRIAQYRDYWNPLILLEATGGLETFKESIND
ncbi:nuclear transport factor 2 family protein [Gynuella sunshinyii]|nr:nuclear transport factor 2 family protein [Gynuella sunshinyii]